MPNDAQSVSIHVVGNRAEAEGRQGVENLLVRTTAPQFLLWSLIAFFKFLLKIDSLCFLGDFKMI